MSIISSLPPTQPSASLPLEDSISAAEWLIAKWRYNRVSATSLPTFLFLTNSHEAREYIRCVHELREVLDFYVSKHSESPNISLAHSLMQSAMQRLEMEFHHLLSINSEYFNAGLTGSDEGEDNMLSNSFADDLKMIANCMIKAGYGIEVSRVYKSVRKQAVEEELASLGFPKFRTLKWSKGVGDDELDQRVRTWIHAMFFAIGRVFHSERILCNHIFHGASDALGESSFAEATSEGVSAIFTTGEMLANAKEKSSTEGVFRLLDMHMAIQEAIPEIESIFSFESTTLVQTQALNLLSKLRYSINSHLNEFESKLRKHSNKQAVPGGGIHALTQSAMDHIARLADHTAILSTIITDHPSPADQKSSIPESFFNPIESPISIRFARLILVLLCKLDKIAETYKEISLSYLFLANNLHFVVEKVRCGSSLLNLIGEAWVITHHRISKKYASKFEFAAWHKVIKSLSVEDRTSAKSADSLRKFRETFEEAIGKQKSWTVVDSRMREDLKASIWRRVVSAYTEFCEACVENLNERDALMLRTADLEIHISDLFNGIPASGSSLSSSSSSASSASSSSSPKLRFFSRLPHMRSLNDAV